ncbi:MAG: CoA-binding protein [Pirellulales bacterium]
MPHNILDTDDAIRKLLAGITRVAVLGIKTEAQAGQPAFYVPQALQTAGLTIVPVPVYYPDVTTILGEPVYRTLAEIPGEIDVVDVFRRPSDIPGHLDDMLKKRPRAVWLQSGIRHAEVARTLSEAGILVVQDRCLMVEYELCLRK